MSAPEATTAPAELTTYTVHLRAVLDRSVDVAASSPEEAVRLVMDRRAEDASPIHARSMRAESVDGADGGYMVVGFCEDCAAVLLDGRDEGRSFSTSDDDSLTFCTPCAKKVEAEPVRAEAEQDGTDPDAPASAAFGEGV